MTLAATDRRWRPTSAPKARRYDDIWFLNAENGWAVNSDGKVFKTSDGGINWHQQLHAPGVYLRCIAFADAQTGWIGTTTPQRRLYQTRDGGAAWTEVTNLPPAAPQFICGLSVLDSSTLYAAGTNDPSNAPAVISTDDGGATWTVRDLSLHANLLVDIHFPQRGRGWVVGGKGDVVGPTSRPRVKPVVLFTEDNGETWRNLIEELQPELPRGEWGWKIFFVNETVGYVSLENFDSGAILKSIDGGKTWVRKAVNDPQGNANLEGIGFLDERQGWVGGWGDRQFRGGFSSRTSDGADSWSDANEIGRFINRFRMIGSPPTVAFASGDTVYKYSTEPAAALAPFRREPDFRFVAEQPLEVTRPVAINFEILTRVEVMIVDIWNRFGVRVRRLIEAHTVEPGSRSLEWKGDDDAGEPVPPGYYIYRVTLDDDSESRVILLADDVRGGQRE